MAARQHAREHGPCADAHGRDTLFVHAELLCGAGQQIVDHLEILVHQQVEVGDRKRPPEGHEILDVAAVGDDRNEAVVVGGSLDLGPVEEGAGRGTQPVEHEHDRQLFALLDLAGRDKDEAAIPTSRSDRRGLTRHELGTLAPVAGQGRGELGPLGRRRTAQGQHRRLDAGLTARVALTRGARITRITRIFAARSTRIFAARSTRIFAARRTRILAARTPGVGCRGPRLGLGSPDLLHAPRLIDTGQRGQAEREQPEFEIRHSDIHPSRIAYPGARAPTDL